MIIISGTYVQNMKSAGIFFSFIQNFDFLVVSWVKRQKIVQNDKIILSVALHNSGTESAKLRALRTKNVLACQRALRAYVLTCQRVLPAYVLTCKRALRAYTLTCLRVLRAFVFTYLRALRAYVLTLKRAILNNVNSYIIQIC